MQVAQPAFPEELGPSSQPAAKGSEAPGSQIKNSLGEEPCSVEAFSFFLLFIGRSWVLEQALAAESGDLGCYHLTLGNLFGLQFLQL